MNYKHVLLKNVYLVSLVSLIIGNSNAQVTWERYQNNPIMGSGNVGTWDSEFSGIISIMYQDGMYKAWIAGMDATDTGRIGYATSPDGIVWTKYENNPVLVPGDAGAWDDMNADHACVLFFDSTFKMWYMAEDEQSSQIGYATSPDGITWEKYSGNPVLRLGATGSWDENEVMHPTVLFDGETYHLWYNGYGQEMQRTGYATSSDGINWDKHPGNPVMTTGVSGSWDDYMLGLMSVIYKDGEFQMWYTAGDGTDEDSKYFRIGYATSTDGANWEKYKDNPIVDIGAVGSWDSLGVVTSAVLFDTIENKYKMWYGGFDGSSFQTGYATSAEAVISPVSATWELTDPGAGGTGQTVSTAGPVFGYDQSFSAMRINGYSGAESSQRTDNRPPDGAIAWPANQLTRIDSVYVQFAVSPRSGTSLHVKNIAFEIGANSSNYIKADVLFSTDSTFSTFNKVPDSIVLEGNDYAYPGYLLRADTLNPVSFALDESVAADQKFYLRVFPWVHDQTSGLTGKYLLLKNLVISGQAEGMVIYDLAEIQTSGVSYISTTFATSGGNIVSDGGAFVTARGVVWNTSGSATIAEAKTSDGDGSGSFTSSVTGLTPGETYYLRAYATNQAGTAYGDEIVFSALSSVTVPTVTTTAVQDIFVVSAESGGEVTNWGGDQVTARGIVWNTTGDPTLADSMTEDGTGMGRFTSFMYPLTETTTYYIRAYATNSAGTGYGQTIQFTTKAPQPDVVKIVDQSGSGDYTTVQAAFDAVPDNYTGQWKIMVNSGVYYEKLFLDRNKVNVILQGVHADSSILTYDDYAGIAGGTSMSYSVAIEPDDFTAIDITFRNTYKNDGSVGDQQAVALRVNGDRQSYYNCKLLGYQDTYYTWGGRATGRTYMKNCYIEGSVDFIFGRNIVLFDSCTINLNRNGGTITAAATRAEAKFGYVFKECIITHEEIGFDGKAITSLSLGRPWQDAPRTVFINTEEPAALEASGWRLWNVPPALYAEYKCYGPGADTTGRLPVSRQLSDEEALTYTMANIFARESFPTFAYDWLPKDFDEITAIEYKDGMKSVPVQFELGLNYPNPFNPTTTFTYSLPERLHVKITVYNILGKKVRTIVDSVQEAGRYSATLNAQNLSSGIYFYTMQAGHFIKTRKMLLLK